MTSTRDIILALFPAAEQLNKSLRELASRVETLTSATSLQTRLDAAVELAAFNRVKDGHISAPIAVAFGNALDRDPRWKRRAVWLSILGASPEVRKRYHDCVAALIAETNGVSLFADSGLPSDRGLLAELSNRLFALLLPAPRDYNELARLFIRMYPSRDEVEHFFSLPPEHVQRIVALTAPDERGSEWQPIVHSLLDSFSLLGARTGVGTFGKIASSQLSAPGTAIALLSTRTHR